jgi:ParB/RepB/Spo0J family partition protein
MASLAQGGQQVPVVVVAEREGSRLVLVDGYKRVRALKRLRQDTVQAVCWELGEAEALVLERLMRGAETDGPLEQGWLLTELQERFGMSVEELAKRFDKSASWVSRRLALVTQLPQAIQERVRRGELAAHAAMKFLVPLARANEADALKLSEALAGKNPSTRQVGALYAAYCGGNAKSRELLLEDPWLFLRAQEEAGREAVVEQSPRQRLLADLGLLGGVSRRLTGWLRQGLAKGLLASEREELWRCARQARAEAEQLWTHCEKEFVDAGPGDADSHPPAA